ncbi:hypothetical protein BDM02DRAFT_3108050 [Thelephora ganbajun]|uniref:Uncharacterized protein n=1 Tax=Thelephora ganbajun TaxID=370292 RepID=A0ACB6ZV46_THEGA|nr:hypothetical protein BDM02DRAFT_3108050 [Thelephora ganbajun]
MSESYVLLEVGSQPYFTTFQDLDGRLAFSINDVEQKPNLLVRLMREPQWSQQHPEIMGPSTSFMYFGPGKSSGYLIYGNGPNQPMNSSVRQKKGVANTRYFTAQNGKELKWKIIDGRMECYNGRTVIATYESVTSADKKTTAKLTIRQPGLPICTEIVTALLLNRMALAFGWPDSP